MNQWTRFANYSGNGQGDKWPFLYSLHTCVPFARDKLCSSTKVMEPSFIVPWLSGEPVNLPLHFCWCRKAGSLQLSLELNLITNYCSGTDTIKGQQIFWTAFHFMGSCLLITPVGT